ncbi:hypothetical protein [Maribacter sp. 2210JD10-5]|uniref:hypothetical protein n=1 Tax=Maribacter sp. 2210JD10-5 TaxID=3386272 RepID=UPI0039BC5C9A
MSILFGLISCKKKKSETSSSPLDPYISFVQKQETSAKDYVLQQFDTYDFVVLAERDHRDITQYELIVKVIADSIFKSKVKHIFLEIGTKRLQKRMNAFLSQEGLSDSEIDKEIKYIQRNAWYFPVWEKHNYAYFFRELYKINQTLKPTEKIKVYPSGLTMNWNTTKTFSDMKNAHKYRAVKDSIMALNIMHDIDSLTVHEPGKKQKALLILNYHHAFNDNFTSENACTNYLFKKYGDRITNIFIHAKSFVVSHELEDSANEGKEVPIQNGKWDAAFELEGNPNIGFDFADSPFGNDYFDYYPYRASDYRYADIFKGYVFYKPISEFKLVLGYDGLLEDGFKEEYGRRLELFKQYRKNDSTFKLGSVSNSLNSVKEYPIEDLDTIQYLINRRIEEHLESRKTFN